MSTFPQYGTLDETIEISDEFEGMMLQTLKPCDAIHMRTCNSDYDIFLLEPESGRVLVKGGKYFAQPMEATVSGSTIGGSMLMMGWLCVGFRAEFHANGRHIVTSPVQELRVERESLGWIIQLPIRTSVNDKRDEKPAAFHNRGCVAG
jgi:hypothetical protein